MVRQNPETKKDDNPYERWLRSPTMKMKPAAPEAVTQKEEG